MLLDELGQILCRVLRHFVTSVTVVNGEVAVVGAVKTQNGVVRVLDKGKKIAKLQPTFFNTNEPALKN